MYCSNCQDPVCFRHEREGLIHKNGKYTCRVQHTAGRYTVAALATRSQEELLRVLSSVKVPEKKDGK